MLFRLQLSAGVVVSDLNGPCQPCPEEPTSPICRTLRIALTGALARFARLAHIGGSASALLELGESVGGTALGIDQRRRPLRRCPVSRR